MDTLDAATGVGSTSPTNCSVRISATETAKIVHLASADILQVTNAQAWSMWYDVTG